MAKQPFRSIGMRVRDFARSHIRSYVSSGETVSRSAQRPSWQENTDEPLVWGDDAASPAPAVAQEEQPFEAAAPEVPSPYPMRSVSSDQVTTNMLQRLLEAHEERAAREEAQKAEIMASQPPALQRQAEAGDNNGDSSTRMPTRRRRGAVIDMPSPHPTPPSDDATPESDATPSGNTTPENDDGSSDFFFLNEAAPTAVQRAPEDSPAPPVLPARETPSPRASNPAASFWRKLFSRGDDTASAAQSSDDSAAIEPDEAAGYSHSESAAALPPSPAVSSGPFAAPTSIQREPESSPVRTRHPVNTPTPEPPSANDPTLLTPAAPEYSSDDAGGADNAPAFSDISPSTPATPTNAPSVQREINDVPVIQRDVDAAPLPDSASPPAIQRAAAPETSYAGAAEPAQNAPASPAGRKGRRNAGQTNRPSNAIQRESGGANPPNPGATPYDQGVIPAPETNLPSPPASTASAARRRADTTAPASEPTRRSRNAQSSAAPAVQPAHSEPTGRPALQRKTDAPSAPEPSPKSSRRASSHETAPSAPMEQPAQPAVQRRAFVPEDQAAGATAPSVEPGQTDASGQTPAPTGRIQRKPTSVGASGQAAANRPPESGSASVQRARHADERGAADGANVPTAAIPGVSDRPAVQRASTDVWENAPDIEYAPLSSITSTPQRTNRSAQDAPPSVQRATRAENSPADVTPIEQAAPRIRVQRKPRASAAPSAEPAPQPQVERPSVQRRVNAPDADAPTRLTPMPVPSDSAQAAPPSAQRAQPPSPDQASAGETNVTADAPTMLTAVPPQGTAAHTSPSVQREVGPDAGAAAPAEPRQASAAMRPPSPWAAFMEPGETTPNVPRSKAALRLNPAVGAAPGQTAAPIQRAPEVGSTRYTPENADDDALPTGNVVPVGENEIDLFSAMMNSGMIQPPPAPAASSPTPPGMSRRSAPDAGSRPAQPSSSEQPGMNSGLEQHVPDRDSTDAELLSLLHLPATTPVIRKSPGETTVARSPAPAPYQETSHPAAPPPTPPSFAPAQIEREDDWGSIQRAISLDEVSSSVSGGENEQGQDVDVNKLARDVLDVLRQRLRVEQERRGGKP